LVILRYSATSLELNILIIRCSISPKWINLVYCRLGIKRSLSRLKARQRSRLLAQKALKNNNSASSSSVKKKQQ
jgi:hypothetical protein